MRGREGDNNPDSFSSCVEDANDDANEEDEEEEEEEEEEKDEERDGDNRGEEEGEGREGFLWMVLKLSGLHISQTFGSVLSETERTT